jgi:SAM-dependent methyltransferase
LLSCRTRASPTAEDPAYFEWEARTAIGAWEYYLRFLPPPPQRILDVGAGPGGRTAVHAQRSPHFFIALDRDVKLQGEALARFREKGVARVAALVGDAFQLPFPEGSLDACLCENALEHFERPDLVVSEMARVVRRGGCLLVLFPPWRGPEASHLSNLTWMPWVHLLPSRLLLRLLAGLAQAREPGPWRERAHGEAVRLAGQLNGWSVARILEAFDRHETLDLVDAYVLGHGSAGRVLRFLPGVGELFTSAVYLVYRRVNRRSGRATRFRDLVRRTFRGARAGPSAGGHA